MNVMVNNYLMVYLKVRKARADVKDLEGESIKTEEILTNNKEPNQRSTASNFNCANDAPNIIKAEATPKKFKPDAIELEVFKLCVAVSMTFVTCWGLMSVLLLWKLIAQGPAPMILDYLAAFCVSLDTFLSPIVLG
jgi:hypothetical protein